MVSTDSGSVYAFGRSSRNVMTSREPIDGAGPSNRKQGAMMFATRRQSARVAQALVVASLCLAAPVLAHEVDPARIPLGDGRRTDAPTQGSIFACQKRFNPNAPGAHAGGNWLNGDGTFDLTKKVSVSGSVTHVSELDINLSGETRQMSGNTLPDHPTGTFPIARTDDAWQFDRNPNRLRSHDFSVSFPAVPQVADDASCVPMGAIGIMLSGAVLFNSLDARGDDAIAHEILDTCQGHPQRDGLYHYHGKSPCQTDTGSKVAGSALLGYAFDGFGIFGPWSEDGHRLSTRDLDACHGHTAEILWDGEQRSLYHYHTTLDYPHVIGCYRVEPKSARGLGRQPRRN